MITFLITYFAEAIANPYRSIELDVDIGADARDWSSIQTQEKLKPIETDLRRIEEMVQEIVSEMEYLRAREQKLRDTNESTNERVKWFAFGTMGMLVGLGAWQVVYLRAYFRYVDDLPLSTLYHSPCTCSDDVCLTGYFFFGVDPSILSRLGSVWGRRYGQEGQLPVDVFPLSCFMTNVEFAMSFAECLLVLCSSRLRYTV